MRISRRRWRERPALKARGKASAYIPKVRALRKKMASLSQQIDALGGHTYNSIYDLPGGSEALSDVNLHRGMIEALAISTAIDRLGWLAKEAEGASYG